MTKPEKRKGAWAQRQAQAAAARVRPGRLQGEALRVVRDSIPDEVTAGERRKIERLVAANLVACGGLLTEPGQAGVALAEVLSALTARSNAKVAARSTRKSFRVVTDIIDTIRLKQAVAAFDKKYVVNPESGPAVRSGRLIDVKVRGAPAEPLPALAFKTDERGVTVLDEAVSKPLTPEQRKEVEEWAKKSGMVFGTPPEDPAPKQAE